jgi:cell division FtsZ-interacting protein ZapD
MSFNTIHIFHFGQVQLIGNEINKSKTADVLTELDSFVEHIKSFIPQDVVLTDYHVIHVFNNLDVRYLGKSTDNKKDKTTFTVKFKDIDKQKLNALVAELSE